MSNKDQSINLIKCNGCDQKCFLANKATSHEYRNNVTS